MIGIIGGNGVAATNKLLQLVEEKYVEQGAFRDCHHPEMIAWQATQAPSRSMYLEGRGESFLEDYVRVGKHLKECGCTILCMCCNTAHYFIGELERDIDIKFINIMTEVAKKCKAIGGGKIGVMCSDGLVKTKLYETYIMKEIPNAEVMFPTEQLQKLVTRGICNAKNSKRYLPFEDDENPAHCFAEVCKWFAQQGCDTVVAGCTDIRNVFYPQRTDKYNYIDSLEVLADKIVETEKNK